jgi:phenylacetate-CoA ligase
MRILARIYKPQEEVEMTAKAMLTGAAHLIAKRVAGPFWRHRRWLEQTQWLSRDQLEEIQIEQLRSLVKHCYATVPFYTRLMDEYDIKPHSIRSLDDMDQFPILNKQEVIKAGASIISNKFPKWTLRKGRTGGSTGTPMIIYRNLASLGTEHAFARRQWDWAGVGMSEKSAWIFQRVVAGSMDKNNKFYEYDPIMRELTLSAFHCSTTTALDYAKCIKAHGIKVVVGYPSSLNLIAKTCLNAGYKLELKVIISTWEAMTVAMNETITKAFGCKIFDFYGSGERVVAIHKCMRGGYHIIPEYGYSELKPVSGGNGDCFKIVSTGFWNKAMPLIRYDIGDVVTKPENCTCDCGREYTVVKSIIGKEGDVIRSPSGFELGVTAVVQILYTIGGTLNILETQIVQDTLDNITLNYVPGAAFTQRDLSQMQKSAARFLPGDLTVNFKEVNAVERTPMGKIRPIISKI